MRPPPKPSVLGQVGAGLVLAAILAVGVGIYRAALWVWNLF
jgi:hypothetical protein